MVSTLYNFSLVRVDYLSGYLDGKTSAILVLADLLDAVSLKLLLYKKIH